MTTRTREQWMTFRDARKALGLSRPAFTRLVKFLEIEVRRGIVDRREKYVDVTNLRKRLEVGNHQ